MSIRFYCEICSACNLRCRYCFEKSGAEKFIAAKELLNFLNIVEDMVEDVVITGGEPTLHPDFYEIVQGIAEKFPTVITTNGTTNVAEQLSGLVEQYPALRVQISLDAAAPEIVNDYCGSGVFDAAVATIDRLSQYGRQVSIAATLLNQTKEEIQKLEQYSKERGIGLYFPALLPYGALNSNWGALMPSSAEYIAVEESILELISESTNSIVSSNKIDTILARFDASSDEVEEPGLVLKIDSSGHLLTCPATDFSYMCSRLGNIGEITSSQQMRNILANYTSCISANMIDDECEQCPVEAYCRRVFCGNCIHMKSNSMESVRFLCQTFKHHYSELIAANRVLQGGQDETPHTPTTDC